MKIELLLAIALVGVVGLPAVLLPSTAGRLAAGLLEGDLKVWAVVGGLLIGAAAHLFLMRGKTYQFLSTFHHEVVHMIFAIVLLAPPVAFNSARGSGSFQHEGPRGPLKTTRDFLITIAPYWFSPLLLIPVAVCWLHLSHGTPTRFIASAIAGLSLALPISQIHVGQPDFAKHRIVVPVVAALWLWAGQTVLVLNLLTRWSIRVIPTMYELSFEVF